uniref:Partial AB-hydrolase lipase domain-containing protein n=1 Tax=Otus sunia TaxID=257818 RepID=A0A8C8BJA9_9STRI
MLRHQASVVLPVVLELHSVWSCLQHTHHLAHTNHVILQVLQRGEMWLLLLVLCLAQGLGDAIPHIEVSHQNPEQFMNISQKICFHGYPSEEYNVLTEDGYFLSINRIPHGKGETGSRLPVLIVHGFSLDGGDWVDNLPSNSLGFILADEGYDVWIGNNRGNSWSRRHLNLSVDQEEFWDFSFHEMAVYDLPAMVDFILRQTGQEKLFYIGHAQGNSVGFIAFSSMPHLAEKIKLFFALAPLYTFHHVKGPVLKLAFLPDVVLKVREVFVCYTTKTQELSTTYTCSNLLTAEICENEIFIIGGYNKNLNVVGSSASLGHSHLQGSRPHPLVLLVSEPVNNWSIFPPQATPPFYRIEDMTVPTALWSGGQDWVNPPPETRRLLPRITNLVRHEHLPDWNHFDHHWGLDAPQRMYRQIVALMAQNPLEGVSTDCRRETFLPVE